MVEAMQATQVLVGSPRLPGDLELAHDAVALVLFAHGSGSSQRSARNRHVARVLHRHGLGTLLFDLLGAAEAATPRHGFDIALLASRVECALEWVSRRDELARLSVGLFGASTGAAAALVAAAMRPGSVGAVVSRGGRPDLAADFLARVQAPTLLIVGGADREVLELNRAALRRLGGARRLELIPDATHLFEEPGALDSVAEMAAAWFDSHLALRRLG